MEPTGGGGVVQFFWTALKDLVDSADADRAMSGTTKIMGTPTSVVEVLQARLFQRPRRTMMDDELYEALDAARQSASQPAALSLSPQARARMAQASGAVPPAADERLRTDDPSERPGDPRELAPVGHVDIRA